MKTLRWLVVFVLAGACIFAYAAEELFVRVDCGDLAGSGAVHLKLANKIYIHRFACGVST